MALGQHKRAVGAFSNYRDTELALMELQSTGFPMNKVSVVGENLDRSEIAGASTGTGKGTDDKVGGGVKAGATAGVVTGGLIGLLGSIGALAIPGVGGDGGGCDRNSAGRYCSRRRDWRSSRRFGRRFGRLGSSRSKS